MPKNQSALKLENFRPSWASHWVLGVGIVLISACTQSVVPITIPEVYSPVTNFSSGYCTDGVFPEQWVWNPANLREAVPQAATQADGQPLIKQIRAGKVIASYSSFGATGATTDGDNTDAHDTTGGAFHRTPYTNWQDGDIFEVYPAVYEGANQQPWIGALPDNYQNFMANKFSVPKNITIRGITVNGKRPVIRNPSTGASNNTLGQGIVYIDQSENIVIENLEIADSSLGGGIGKAGIYINGAKNLTLRDIKITGFKTHEANGIFGTGNNSGTLRLERVELDSNGGGGGPEHNAYINASSSDPNFTVYMTGSWTHGAYYGHLFKSRAQVNVFEGNYFMGSRWNGTTQTENYLADFPNGGRVTLRNNIFVKNHSGDNSNAMSVTYAMEGVTDARVLSLDIQHNTFVSLDRTYDASHPIYPMQFYYPAQIPGAGFPVSNTVIADNVFVGYCQQNQTFMDFRGDNPLELNFNQIDQSFKLRDANTTGGNPSVKGTLEYAHPLKSIPRITALPGARD